MKKNKKIKFLSLAITLIACLDSVSETIEVPAREKSLKSLPIPKTSVNKNIVEHKINGRIDSIEIRPIIGQPYYLIDNDDNLRKGTNQTGNQNEILSNWRLLQW